MGRKLVSYRLDDDLTETLKQQADIEGISATELVNRLLRQGLLHAVDSPVDKRLAALEESVRKLEKKVDSCETNSSQVSTHIPQDLPTNKDYVLAKNLAGTEPESGSNIFVEAVAQQLERQFNSVDKAVAQQLERQPNSVDEALAQQLERQLLSLAGATDNCCYLEHIKITCGYKQHFKAEVTLKNNHGERCSRSATGNGPIDAAYEAIDQAISIFFSIREHRLTSIYAQPVQLGKEDSDALVVVSVNVECDNKLFSAFGIDTDSVVASAYAYIKTLNSIYKS